MKQVSPQRNRKTKALLGILTLTAILVTQVHAQTCVSPPSGLVAWWPMDGSVMDIAGTNNPSDTNAISFVPGEVGLAVCFTNGGYIDIPDSVALENQTLSFVAWANPFGPGPGGVGEDASIIILKDVDELYYCGLFWNYSGDARFSFQIGNDEVTSSNSFPAGCYYHVAGTYDGNMLKLFVNGSLEGQLSSPQTITYDPSIPWVIGADPPYWRDNGYPNTFIGTIDEVTIFNRALSSSEVAALYAAGSAGMCKYPELSLVSLTNAVKLSFSILEAGTNYQLQISSDLINWTNQGSPFTPTNGVMDYPQYFDVDNWNQLFFRLQMLP